MEINTTSEQLQGIVELQRIASEGTLKDFKEKRAEVEQAFASSSSKQGAEKLLGRIDRVAFKRFVLSNASSTRPSSVTRDNTISGFELISLLKMGRLLLRALHDRNPKTKAAAEAQRALDALPESVKGVGTKIMEMYRAKGRGDQKTFQEKYREVENFCRSRSDQRRGSKLENVILRPMAGKSKLALSRPNPLDLSSFPIRGRRKLRV